MSAADRERYARRKADPEVYRAYLTKVNAQRKSKRKAYGARARSAGTAPSRPMPAPNAVPGITLARLMAGR